MKKKEMKILEKAEKIRNKEVSRKIIFTKERFDKEWYGSDDQDLIHKLVQEAFPEYKNIRVSDDPEYSRDALVYMKVEDGREVRFNVYQMNKDFQLISDYLASSDRRTNNVSIDVKIKFPLIYYVTVKPYKGL